MLSVLNTIILIFAIAYKILLNTHNCVVDL